MNEHTVDDLLVPPGGGARTATEVVIEARSAQLGVAPMLRTADHELGMTTHIERIPALMLEQGLRSLAGVGIPPGIPA